MNLYYLGPEGTFSHDAAAELTARFHVAASLSPQSTVEGVARSVAAAPGQPVIGLVPYYNFLEGLVQEHLDLIYEFRLRIIGALRLPVQFSAGAFETPPAPASEVFSHPKALAQVSEFVQSRLTDAVLSPVSSTSEAARIVAERKRGVAIASESALKRFGVPVFARDVGNLRRGKGNFTDFFVVQADGADIGIDLGEPDHAIIAVTPPIDRPGLLAELLGQFHFYGLDIAKIHSRPAIGAAESPEEPQMFYLEVKCAPAAEALSRCVDAIRYRFGRSAASGDLVRLMGGFRIA